MKKRMLKIISILLVVLCTMQTAGCMCAPVAVLSAVAAAEADLELAARLAAVLGLKVRAMPAAVP